MAPGRLRRARAHAGGAQHRRAPPPRRRLSRAVRVPARAVRSGRRSPGDASDVWIPFGGGIRRCLGATLAMAEQQVVLARSRGAPISRRRTRRPSARRQRNVTMIPARRRRGRERQSVLAPPSIAWPRAKQTAPDHRERLIAAMAASVEERGYPETTVAHVVRLARTSRRTFYEHFQDRADCFLALFDVTNDQVLAALAAAVDRRRRRAPGGPGARCLPGCVASRPALSRSFVRELPALGERGAEHQLATIERFARQLVELVEQVRREQPGLACGRGLDTAIMIVGGVRELVVIPRSRVATCASCRQVPARWSRQSCPGRCCRCRALRRTGVPVLDGVRACTESGTGSP